MAYEQVTGPIGGIRDDFHAAMITAQIANSNRGKRAPISTAKFLPEWDQQEQTADDMFAIAREINAALGGTETRG